MQSNAQAKKLEKLEHIKHQGLARFIVLYGLPVGLSWGVAMYIFPRPPVHWFILVPMLCFVGLLWGTIMWFLMMRQYDNLKKSLK
jgi:hypothetical protein